MVLLALASPRAPVSLRTHPQEQDFAIHASRLWTLQKNLEIVF